MESDANDEVRDVSHGPYIISREEYPHLFGDPNLPSWIAPPQNNTLDPIQAEAIETKIRSGE